MMFLPIFMNQGHPNPWLVNTTCEVAMDEVGEANYGKRHLHATSRRLGLECRQLKGRASHCGEKRHMMMNWMILWEMSNLHDTLL